MPCHAAMIDKLLTLLPDDNVEGAVRAMKKAGVDTAPVVDQSGALVGVFSLQGVLEEILPVSIAMADGLQLDVNIGAAPGIARRLKKVLPLKVADLMERQFQTVTPETPLWEGVSQLVQGGNPLLVAESKSGRVLGMMTMQSALDELTRLKDSET